MLLRVAEEDADERALRRHRLGPLLVEGQHRRPTDLRQQLEERLVARVVVAAAVAVAVAVGGGRAPRAEGHLGEECEGGLDDGFVHVELRLEVIEGEVAVAVLGVGGERAEEGGHLLGRHVVGVAE